MDIGTWRGCVGWAGINFVDWAAGDILLGGRGISAVGLFSGASVLNGRRGFDEFPWD